MTQKTMYDTIIGDYKTALTVAYNAGADTTINVASASFLPTAPNTCTVRIPNQTYLVTIKYTGKTNTTLTGVSVVEGTPTAALTAVFPIGSEVSKPLAHDDVDAMQDNISDLASAKVDKYQGTEYAGKILKVGDDGYVTTGTAGVSDYEDLTNKPQINSVELIGNKSLSDLGAQPTLVSGTNIKTINSQSVLGAGNIQIDGVTDYDELDNRPQINSVTLTGNKSLSDLGIASESDLTTHTGDSTIHVTASDKTTWNAKASMSDIPTVLPCPNAITFTGASTGTYDGSSALSINIPQGGSGGSVSWGNIGGTLSNQTDLSTALTGKQDVLSSTNQLNADYIATTTSKQFVSSSEKSGWDAKADTSDIPTALSELTADATHRLVTDAEKTAWTGKQDAITSTAKLSADLVDDSSATNKFYHTHASTHALNGGDAVSLDASQVTSGIFSADRIPALAYQRMVTVADETAKSALTSDDVSVGDTVYVQDGSKLYIVSSITGKGTASEVINYVIYTAYVSWNSITGKPSTYTPSAHASTHVNGDDDIQLANTSQKGLLSASDWNTFNAKQSALTFDSTPTASSTNPVTSGGVYTALAGKQDTLTIEQTPTTSTTAIVSSNGVKSAISNKVRSGTTAPTVTGDETLGDIYVQYT